MKSNQKMKSHDEEEALSAIFSLLPSAAAEVLLKTLRRPGRPVPAPSGLPWGVTCVADSRFLFFYAEKRAVVRWNRPGRELVTGCYLAPGDTAQLKMEPGEVRLVILRDSGSDA